jgi:hypothetical protein
VASGSQPSGGFQEFLQVSLMEATMKGIDIPQEFMQFLKRSSTTSSTSHAAIRDTETRFDHDPGTSADAERAARD